MCEQWEVEYSVRPILEQMVVVRWQSMFAVSLNAGHFYRIFLEVASRDTPSLNRGGTSGECGSVFCPDNLAPQTIV